MEEVEERTLSITCDLCLSCGFSLADGFFYCDCCGYQAPDIMDTGFADEHFVGMVSDTPSEDVSDDETSSQYESLSQSGFSLSPDRDMNIPEEEAEEEGDHDDTSACCNTPTGDG